VLIKVEYSGSEVRGYPSSRKYLGLCKKRENDTFWINPTVYTQIENEIYFVKRRQKKTSKIVDFPAMAVKIGGIFGQKEGSHSSHCYVFGTI